MKYRLSKFTRTVNVESGDIIIYNTYTGKQSYIFDTDIKEQLHRICSYPQDETDIDHRLISNFCVPVDMDENMFVYNKVKGFMDSSDSLSLILFPTLDCNFNCSYCYENKEKGIMSNETFENIYSSIVNHYEVTKYRFLKLEWFGGEPLLCYEKILNFTKRVNDFCDEKGILFQHSITTNGYLLSPIRIKSLLDNKVITYQITIDGAAKTHDSYRHLKDGKATWKTIIDNLVAMKEFNDNFAVLIRVNYNYEILDSIEEFLDIYKEKFGDDERYELAFKPIGHWGGENDAAVEIVPFDYHSFVLDELLKMCKSRGLLSTANFSFSCGSELCYANKKNCFVVYKNGYLGKCTLEEQPEEGSDFVIGNLNEGYFKIDNYKESKWLPNDLAFINYLNSNGCFDCIAYPFCCGTTCPAHRVKHGMENRAKCTPTKNNIDNIVSLNYEISKKG